MTAEWSVLELPGLVPIGHVSVHPEGPGRIETWSVAPHHLVWFTADDPLQGPLSPRGVQIRASTDPPPLAPAGTWTATQQVVPLPVTEAPSALPRMFRIVGYAVHEGESYSSLPLPMRGFLFRSTIGRSVQEWWFLHDDYAPPSGTRVTELRPVSWPRELGPRRAAEEAAWVQARAAAPTYVYRQYVIHAS